MCIYIYMYTYVDFDLVFGQYVRYHLDFALGDTSQEKNAMQRYLWGEAIAKHIGKLEHEEPVTYVAFSETIRDDV